MSKEWKWTGTYPVRCRIMDVEGKEIFPGVMGRTPEASKPHLGKEGTASVRRGVVEITLDDGSTIYGHQCWWEPLPTKEAV